MLTKILRKSFTAKSTDHHDVVSEELSTWEIVDPTLTDDDDDLYSLDENAVENKGVSVSVLLDDVTCLVKDEKEAMLLTRLLSGNDDLYEDDGDVYEDDDDVDDDDGLEEDLMPWKLKGRFEKQKMGKRGVSKSALNKMPCYYYTRPKTVLERRGKRLFATKVIKKVNKAGPIVCYKL